jgi:hypothetical protein
MLISLQSSLIVSKLTTVENASSTLLRNAVKSVLIVATLALVSFTMLLSISTYATFDYFLATDSNNLTGYLALFELLVDINSLVVVSLAKINPPISLVVATGIASA